MHAARNLNLRQLHELMTLKSLADPGAGRPGNRVVRENFARLFADFGPDILVESVTPQGTTFWASRGRAAVYPTSAQNQYLVVFLDSPKGDAQAFVRRIRSNPDVRDAGSDLGFAKDGLVL